MNVITNQLHLFMASVLPNSYGLFQKEKYPCRKVQNVCVWFQKLNKEQNINPTVLAV